MVEPLRVAYVATLTVAVLTNLGVVYWVRQRDRSRAAQLFVLNILLATLYALGGILETMVPGREAKVFFAALRYPPLWASIVAWTAFSLHYVGREAWLTRRRWAGLLGLAGTAALLDVTNPLHNLVFTNVRLDPTPFPHLVAEPTTLYWVLATPAYLLLLGSSAVIAKALLTSRRAGRRQALILAGGIVPAVVVSVAQSVGYLPSNGFQYLSITGAGFSLAVAYALFGEDLFAVDPVSRAAVIESVSDAVVVLDGRFRVVDFNGAATPLGVDDGDVGSDVGSVLPGLIEGDDPVEPDGGTQTAAAALGGGLGVSNEDAPGDLVVAGAGGERFAERLVAQPGGERREYVVQPSVVGDEDAPSGYVIVLRDVTEIEAYAARLKRQTDQLDRFASTVSHDLRNPLSVARAYVETTAEDGDLDRLEEAIAALDRADEIIDQSLTLAREGRAIEGRERVALATAAHEAWSTADTGDATLAVATDRAVSADPDRLCSLLENLFRNAVEHGDADEVVVQDREDGFAVADDGSGIDRDVADEVFERGYTTSDDGTGLGLAIVESIADAHGWTVGVDESPEGGARFTFSDAEVVDRAGGETGRSPLGGGD